jgi:predicted nucleic acid-binding protein
LIIVDASVLANAIGDDTSAGRTARDRLRRDDLGAPDLVYVETLGVLRRRLSVARLRGAVSDLLDLDLVTYPAAPLLRRAAELNENVTPYDAMYVGLAELTQSVLVTGDARLARASGPRCVIEVLSEDGA